MGARNKEGCKSGETTYLIARSTSRKSCWSTTSCRQGTVADGAPRTGFRPQWFVAPVFTLAISGVPDIAPDFPVTIQVLPASSASKLLPSYVAVLVLSTVFVLSNSRVHFALFLRVVATPITRVYHIRVQISKSVSAWFRSR